jgi:Transposase DDE domain
MSWAIPNGENFDWNSPNRGVSCRNGPAPGHLDIGGGQGGLELVDPPGDPPHWWPQKLTPLDPPLRPLSSRRLKNQSFMEPSKLRYERSRFAEDHPCRYGRILRVSRATITQRGITPVIPPKANRNIKRECDFALYGERNLIERFFNLLKHFRAIATRYDKLARNFLAGVQLAAVTILLN